ncbi:hypothetical protein GH714_038041 [Hevea brasiliensis]|uniref:Uncharacterized protein n=1 Tax=Hevea brasiliensis TaxID=3981 RepID=A0A6A6KE55_HEVBR|nr:hypothetical protein GH714_038041 [Hevea brasiliensis]
MLTSVLFSRIVENDIENRVPENSNLLFSDNRLPKPSEVTPLKSSKSDCCASSREGTPTLRSNSVNVKKMQRMFKNAAEDNIQSIRAYVTELKERVAKLQYQKQLLVCQVLELEANEAATVEADATEQSPWPGTCSLRIKESKL